MVLNPAFATAGATAQLADGWSVRAKAHGSVELAFGAASPVLIPIAAPNDASAGSWLANGITVTTNTGNDPDGAATADTLTDTAANTLHALTAAAQAIPEDGCAAFSVHVQDISRGYCAVGWRNGFGDIGYAIVDLTLGSTVLTARTGLVDKVSAIVTDLGNAWFLVEVAVVTSADIAAIHPFVSLATATSITYLGTLQAIRVWGASVNAPEFEQAEGFERAWGNDDALFFLTFPTSAIPATFITDYVDPNPFEDFETGWANYPFLTAISGGTSASFDEDGTPEDFEDFTDGWNAIPFYETVIGGTAASFDEDTPSPEDFEDFEDGWLSAPYATTITGGVAAIFDGPDAPEAFEDFEEVIADVLVQVNTGTDTIVATGHTFGVAAPGYLDSTAEMPEPLYNNVLYWPVNVVAGVSFQLALTPGGAAINLTTQGVGVLTFRADPTRFWNGASINQTI